MRCNCGNTTFSFVQTIVHTMHISYGQTEIVDDKECEPMEGPFRCTHCGREFEEYEDKDHSRGRRGKAEDRLLRRKLASWTIVEAS